MNSVTAYHAPQYPGQPGMAERYRAVRRQSEVLAAPLTPEDMAVQTMPNVSPTKWHLAHVSWFFETFLLGRQPDYRVFDERFHYLFNSYYQTAGTMHPRPQRGLLSRPDVQRILEYRAHVDEHMEEAIHRYGEDPEFAGLVVLGLHHEQQHQELMLTDIKHVFSCNPLEPAYQNGPREQNPQAPPLRFHSGPEGIREIGFSGSGFGFDNETPRHTVLLHPHAIANRLVTCGEFRDFIRDGGYRRPELWLSDGWSTVQAESWNRPSYWGEDLESIFSLDGRRELDPNEPVTHVSFYEADAFASWAGYRLPSEAEWEVAAAEQTPRGNFADSGHLHPFGVSDGGPLSQIFGDCWEWTRSAYAPYPGYQPPAGTIGEYNGKFMCNQMVLRGGSCVTPPGHIRATYRNFFYPPDRWQFTGIRLARDE